MAKKYIGNILLGGFNYFNYFCQVIQVFSVLYNFLTIFSLIKMFFFSIWKYEKVKSLILRSSIVVEEKLTKENLVFHSLAVSLNDFFFVKLNFNAVLQFVYCTIKFDNYGHKLLKKLFSKIIMQGY